MPLKLELVRNVIVFWGFCKKIFHVGFGFFPNLTLDVVSQSKEIIES